MDIDLFRGITTAVLLVLFIGIWVWTWSKKRSADYDAASRLPLEDSQQPPNHDGKEREQ